MFAHPPYKGPRHKLPLVLFARLDTKGEKFVGFLPIKGTWAEMASLQLLGPSAFRGLRKWVEDVKMVQARYPNLQPVRFDE